VVIIVLSRLDYGNGVLVGLPAYLVRRLQSILYASARMIFLLSRSDYITDALAMQFALAVHSGTHPVVVLAHKVRRNTTTWFAVHYSEPTIRKIARCVFNKNSRPTFGKLFALLVD